MIKCHQKVNMSIDESYECLKNPNLYGYEIEYFWISGVALACVECFGLIGNICNIMILILPSFRKMTFYQLFIVMAFVDIDFILFFGVQNWNAFMVCSSDYNEAICNLTKCFVDIGRSLSVYTTVAISIDRFLKICYPFLIYRPKTWHYVTLIMIFSLFYNLPEFFERRFFVKNGILHEELKPYAKDEKYDWWYRWFIGLIAMIIEYVLSFLIVLFLNIAIILTTRKSKKNVLIYTNDNERRQIVTKYSLELTKTILILVAFFLVSRLVCFGSDCLYFFFKYDQYRKWIYLDPIQNFLLMLNSSVNFAIYLLIDTRYRRQFLYMLRCRA